MIVHEPHPTGYHEPSASMEPTLHCAIPAPGCTARYADRLKIGPAPSLLRRGQIVAFRAPRIAEQRCGASGVYIQRVIGLPGERVQERSGYVYVNGRKLSEPYVTAGRRDRRNGAATVPSAGYFVMGDNRSSTCDSRVWGPLPRSAVVGVVTKVFRQR